MGVSCSSPDPPILCREDPRLHWRNGSRRRQREAPGPRRRAARGGVGVQPDLDRELLSRAFRTPRGPRGPAAPVGEEFIHHRGRREDLRRARLDEQTIAAALLHDVVEDTDVELDELAAEFGDEIAQLVEGVTKLTRIQFQSREQARPRTTAR
jgi:hypothetical protein